MSNLKEIVTQGRHCSTIIETTLSTNGTKYTEREFEDINVIISESLHELQYYKAEVDIHICKKLQPNLPCVHVNPDTIHQMLNNVFKNAVDAMQDSEEKILTVISSENNGQLCIEITDTGAGIATKSRDQIFNSFYTTKGSDGMGLGLSICKNIVEDHKGTIKVTSEKNNGTRFQINLPSNPA